MLIRYQHDIAIIHILRRSDAGTVVRLIVARNDDVGEAFYGRHWQDALKVLVTQEQNSSESAKMTHAVSTHLRALKQAVAHDPNTQKQSKQEKHDNPIQFPGDARRQRQAAAKPWNPWWIARVTFFFTPIMAGLVYGLNWRRLRKPNWTLPTMILGVLCTVLLVGIMVVAFFVTAGEDQTQPGNHFFVFIMALILSAGIYLVFAITLNRLQQPAFDFYKLHQTTDILDQHTYPFLRVVGTTVGSMLLFVSLSGVFAYIQTNPNTFENDTMHITYPNDFARVSLAEIEDCQSGGWDCQFAVQDAEFGFSWLLIARAPAPAGTSLSELFRESLNYDIDYNEMRLAEDFFTEVAGIEAGRYLGYLPPQGPDDDDNNFMMTTVFLHEGYVYTIWAHSENPGIFRERREDFNQLINGIRFK